MLSRNLTYQPNAMPTQSAMEESDKLTSTSLPLSNGKQTTTNKKKHNTNNSTHKSQVALRRRRTAPRQQFQRGGSDRGRSIKTAARMFIFAAMNFCFILPSVYVFMVLEGPASVQRKEALYREQQELLLARNISHMRIDKLVRVQEIMCKKMRGNPWTYRHSLHLAYSIITTIGFGELAPITPLGKLTAIGYGVFGIALNILCLGSLRLILNMLIYRLLWWYARCKRGITRHTRSFVKVTFTLVLITVLWAMTALFTYSHGSTNWSWFLSWYNTFIAVTTIGFGDVVIFDDFNNYLNIYHDLEPNTFLEHMLQLLFMINIILILALFSTMFELIQKTNVRRVSKRVSHIVNIIHQTQAKDKARLNPILALGRESVGAGSVMEVLPTIMEMESERDSCRSEGEWSDEVFESETGGDL
ncbi:hypothetical protein ACHWQZ_G013259 [Mnemiopsis leidyi]